MSVYVRLFSFNRFCVCQTRYPSCNNALDEHSLRNIASALIVQTVEHCFFAEWGGFGSHRGVFGKPPIPKGKTSLLSNNGRICFRLSQTFSQNSSRVASFHARIELERTVNYSIRGRCEEKGTHNVTSAHLKSLQQLIGSCSSQVRRWMTRRTRCCAT